MWCSIHLCGAPSNEFTIRSSYEANQPHWSPRWQNRPRPTRKSPLRSENPSRTTRKSHYEVAPVTEIVTTISESIRTDSRNRPKSTPSVPKSLGTPSQHRPYRAIGRVFAASRRRRAQISSITLPPGANFKHRAVIGRVLTASRRRQALLH
jgi:hypothetical protein